MKLPFIPVPAPRKAIRRHGRGPVEAGGVTGILEAAVGAAGRMRPPGPPAYSTVTDLARLRGWSTSVPLMTAVW
jgi:hypothetical protein